MTTADTGTATLGVDSFVTELRQLLEDSGQQLYTENTNSGGKQISQFRQLNIPTLIPMLAKHNVQIVFTKHSPPAIERKPVDTPSTDNVSIAVHMLLGTTADVIPGKDVNTTITYKECQTTSRTLVLLLSRVNISNIVFTPTLIKITYIAPSNLENSIWQRKANGTAYNHSGATKLSRMPRAKRIAKLLEVVKQLKHLK